RDALGIRGPGRLAGSLGDVPLPEPRLSPELRQELGSVVGPEHLRDDPESRIRHTRGKSTPDLLRLRLGDATAAPDAVLLPASHDEVAALLELCAAHRVAVTPFGGGSSVVGGLTPAADGFAGSIALDLGRLNSLL